MEFRLLGPVELRVAQRSVPVGEPRRRLVLAALLVDAGRTIGADTLVSRVWGESAPERARRTLHAHLSHLRRTLAQAEAAEQETGSTPAPVQLFRDSGGYRLAVDPEQVDLARFRQLTAQARDPAGSPVERASLLRTALSQWRGEALAGLSSDWVDRFRRSIEQERIDIVVAWGRAELLVGNAAEVLSPLAELIDENPLLEPAAEVLIRALQAVGRSADALEQFSGIRRRLRDELGADPGPDLRKAQQDVLQGSRQPVTIARPAVPAQLPADVAAFTGRDIELANLLGLLDQLPPEPDGGESSAMVIAAMPGTAGVGKTALAVRLAHRIRERFPGGQLFVDLRGYDPENAMNPAEALGGFLTAMAASTVPLPPGLTERAARFRSELTGRRVLILLDNAATVEQVRPLLPGTAGCLVLVTSRDSLAGLVARDGAHRLDLDLLPAADATVLLHRLIGARTASELEATVSLAQRCARLPLALRVAAEFAVSRPAATLAELVEELDDERRLDLLRAGGDERAAVRTVFSWSIRQLPAAAARLFRLLGVFPGPDADAYLAAALLAGTLDEAHQLLDQLTRAHLIHRVGVSRYGMHDLLRAYARDLVGSAESGSAQDARDALGRAFDYYLATAATSMDVLHPGEGARRPRVAPATTPVPSLSTPDAARRWLERERAGLLALATDRTGAERPGHVVQLSAVLFRYFDSGDHTEALSIHTAGLQAARRRAVPAEEALALNFLGAVSIQTGDYSSAADHFQQALELFARLRDHSGQARVLGNLGTLQERRADFSAAAGYYERSLPLFIHLGDRAGEAHILTRLGAVALRLGHLDAAAVHLTLALVRHRQAGHRFGEAWALTGLGDVEARQGRDEAAVEHLSTAQSLFSELGDLAGEAWALTGLGDVATRFERHRSATEHHEQALVIFRRIGERDGEVAALNGVGEAALADGRAVQAVRFHSRALDIAGAGARDQQARAHAGLARAMSRNLDAEQADRHCALALRLHQELGIPGGAELLLEFSSRE